MTAMAEKITTTIPMPTLEELKRTAKDRGTQGKVGFGRRSASYDPELEASYEKQYQATQAYYSNTLERKMQQMRNGRYEERDVRMYEIGYRAAINDAWHIIRMDAEGRWLLGSIIKKAASKIHSLVS